MSARLVPVQGVARRVGWLLLAANGRPVAGSSRTYRDEDALDRAVRELLIGRNSLNFTVARDEAHTWWWTAFLPARSTAAAAEPVARSGRGYLRRDQCDDGTVTFVATLNQLRAGRPPRTDLMNVR